jgi:valine--pyruvate aminotransferase
MKLSIFGQNLTNKSGILELMDDLGKAMSCSPEEKAQIKMLGGGNPAHIPSVKKIWRERMEQILSENEVFDNMLGNYDTPKGNQDYCEAVADFFNKKFNWNISCKNVAIMPSSQTTFFFLFNMLAGKHKDSSFRKIVFPIAPEYIGYADQGINKGMFKANRPKIDIISEHRFKYKIDFDNLEIGEEAAAVCISRPANPTGNVVTDKEVEKLSQICKQNKIPLIIDNAYGKPFPNIIFSDIEMRLEDHIIHSFSLSKLGLPGVRTSIVVANEEIIEKLSGINAIVSLATGNIGQVITLPYMKSGELYDMSLNKIKPFYKEKSEQALSFFDKYFKDADFDYYIHKSEGALFLWIWFKNLPVPVYKLYEKLKKRKVLVVPGNYFFPGLEEDWQHKHECIRVTYSQSEQQVREGVKIIAEEVKKIYTENKN